MISDLVSSDKKNKFCHLHVHSEYSLVDGCMSVNKILSTAKKRGHTHVALTDHANMHGAVDFYLEAKKQGIIPIIGCEIYHHGIRKNPTKEVPFHLLLLAQDTSGYKNLMKLVSNGYLGENLGDVAVVSDIDSYCDSLVALSGGDAGEFNYLVSRLDRKKSNLVFSGKYYDQLCSHVSLMKNRICR